MAQDSKIEWTDHTVNLWWGCSKVHTGCKNCYAEYQSDKMKRGMRDGSKLWGINSFRRKIKSSFTDLLKYQKLAESKSQYLKIFCGSMMDIFEDSKPMVDIKGNKLNETTHDIRVKLFNEILYGFYPNLIFLFLTKRPENVKKYAPAEMRFMDNVWIGTSVSDQETTKYADILSGTNIKNRFLSIEPQIGVIKKIDLYNISWVIQGGESGAGKRPFDLDWAYLMKEHCSRFNVPYFFKQIDKVQPIPNDLLIREFPASFDLISCS